MCIRNQVRYIIITSDILSLSNIIRFVMPSPVLVFFRELKHLTVSNYCTKADKANEAEVPSKICKIKLFCVFFCVASKIYLFFSCAENKD